MFEKILVTLDGSSFSEWALSYAVDLAQRTDAALELASVHEPIPSFSYDEWEAAALDWTEEYLDRKREELREELSTPVDAWVGTGQILESILGHANTVGADLIVAATHGRGAVSRAWLGSVADGLIRRASQPVLLIRPEKGEQPPEEVRFRRIVLPLDGSGFAESVKEKAVRLARLYDAELHLVRVIAYPIEIASPYLPHTVQMNQEVVDEAKAAAKSYLENICRDLSGDGVSAESHVVVDSQAGQAICAAAEEIEADLVVMATHGRGGLKRALLGSTADKVIRSARIPVLVQRPDFED